MADRLFDYDAIVTRVAGQEGGHRYKRLGKILALGGSLCVLMLVTLPLFIIAGESLSYWDMSGASDATPLYIPNEEVIGYANWAIAGFVLMVLVGIMLYLEGRGTIDLRRYMIWHAEVRATALYSLAAVVAFIGTVSAGSLVAFSFAEPTIVTSIVSIEEVSSPAGMGVLVIGILMVLGLLFMVYYNTVLSVYRGGPPYENRSLARYGMVVAFLCLMGVFMLHSMNVMVITIDYQPPAQDVDYTIPYTYADIKYLVDTNQAEEGIRQLDLNLAVMGWSLLICGLLSMGCMIGIAALSLGSQTRRVRYTVSLQAFVVVFAIVALATSLVANRTVGDLGRVGLFYAVFPQVATPILAGIAISVVVIAAVTLYILEIGIDFVKEAIRPSKEPVTDTSPEGVPAAAGMESPTPSHVSKEKGPPPWRAITAGMVVLVIIAAAIGAVAFRGIGDFDDDGDQTLDITSLDQYLETSTVDLYFDEDQVRSIDVLTEVVNMDLDTSVVFLYNVEATISWTDEPDERMVVAQWENQPDTFSADLQDDMGLVNEHGQSSNDHGMTGFIELRWDMGTTLLGYGNNGLLRIGEDEVEWDDPVTLWITMVDAGDQTHMVRPDRVDGGNNCRVELVIEGYIFSA